MSTRRLLILLTFLTIGTAFLDGVIIYSMLYYPLLFIATKVQHIFIDLFICIFVNTNRYPPPPPKLLLKALIGCLQRNKFLMSNDA